MVSAHQLADDNKHLSRDRNMLMRKNSVRGAIRKSSRQNSITKESTGKDKSIYIKVRLWLLPKILGLINVATILFDFSEIFFEFETTTS